MFNWRKGFAGLLAVVMTAALLAACGSARLSVAAALFHIRHDDRGGQRL